MSNLNEEFYAKFDKIEQDFDELQGLISSVEIIADNKLFNYYKKKYDRIYKIATLYKNYKNIFQQIEENNRLLSTESDTEFLNELKIEQKSLQGKKD